jgi:regulator of sigma E protease
LGDIVNSIVGVDGVILGTIVPFLFVLTVVVFVHEMGHYLVGRWCGIGVKAFSIGFGPELVGFNDRHGTRWKLSAIPLGGYVKFTGDMNATSTPDAAEIEALTEEERKVAFHTQPVWKRALTVFAGPFFNFLLTIAVFAVLFGTYGRPVIQPVVAEVVAGSAAEQGGFKPGDRFVSVDGNRVESFADVQRYVSARTDDQLAFVMLRDGKEITLTATPRLTEQKDALGNTIKVGVIGVATNQEVGQGRVEHYGPLEAVGQAVWRPGRLSAGRDSFSSALRSAARTSASSAGRSRSPRCRGRPRSSDSCGWSTWSRCCPSASASSTCCRFHRSTEAIWSSTESKR